MYTYYCIKLVLVNGTVGYAEYGGLTSNINNAMFFDTYSEAKDWYVRNIKYTTYNGIAVDTSKCTIVSVNSNESL